VREISSLLNSEVISVKEGKRLGVISQAVYDLAAGKLLGLIVGKGPAEKGIRAADIKTWGPDVVMVDKSEVAKRLSELPELLAGRRDPGRPPQQVVTDAGQRLGRLSRVYLEQDSFLVVRFEVSGGAWRDLTEGVLSMPVVRGIIHGPDTIIVPAEAVAKATEGASLKASVEKAAETVREAASEGAKSVREAGEAAAEGAKHLADSVGSAESLKKALTTPLGHAEPEPAEKPAPKAAKPKPAAAKPKAPAAKKPPKPKE
jgi:uncharacterized protein YrrD